MDSKHIKYDKQKDKLKSWKKYHSHSFFLFFIFIFIFIYFFFMFLTTTLCPVLLGFAMTPHTYGIA